MSYIILVVGSGAREAAIAAALAGSPKVRKVYVAPGNAGTAAFCENVPIELKGDDYISKLLQFSRANHVDLTVVGPEGPLADGIVDAFEAEGEGIVGPTRAAASVETSKAAARLRAYKAGVPGPQFAIFTDPKSVLKHAIRFNGEIVLKADGLAGGKGAYVCDDLSDIDTALQELMVEHKFGAAGDIVIAEEKLTGSEMSMHGLCNGLDAVMLIPSFDYKRLSRRPGAPNTGGMGAIAMNDEALRPILDWTRRTIIEPMLRSLASDGIPFRGFMYPGLMMTGDEPKVLEFNCRMGDPETSAILALLASDPFDFFSAAEKRHLGLPHPFPELRWSKEYAVCVVAAAEGYPQKPKLGMVARGMKEASRLSGVQIIHAGTKLDQDGCCVVSGGRAFNVVAKGTTLNEARERAYEALKHISFEGMQYREDIAEDFTAPCV